MDNNKIESSEIAQTHITIASTHLGNMILGKVYAIKDYHSALIQLYGIAGNLYSSLTINDIIQGESSFSIDTSTLSNGLYIVVSKFDNEQIITKVLIQR